MTRPLAALFAALFVALTLIAATPAAAQPAPDDLRDRFQRASQTFEEAVAQLGRDEAAAADGLRLAAERYLALADDGAASSDVYTNAANARLLSGDLGEAVALYHRALRLDPGDRNAAQNLAVARTRASAGAAVEPARTALETATGWRRAVPADARAVIAAAAWAALWLWAAARVAGRTRLHWSIVAVPALAVGGVAAATLAADHQRAAGAPVGVVVAPETTGRTGPDAVAYEPSFTAPLPEGAEFRVVSTRERWVRARLADGRETWLPRADVELVGLNHDS